VLERLGDKSVRYNIVPPVATLYINEFEVEGIDIPTAGSLQPHALPSLGNDQIQR
jgi:hypothetical protein